MYYILVISLSQNNDFEPNQIIKVGKPTKDLWSTSPETLKYRFDESYGKSTRNLCYTSHKATKHRFCIKSKKVNIFSPPSWVMIEKISVQKNFNIQKKTTECNLKQVQWTIRDDS